MARWIVAAAALALGSAVTGGLLFFANPARDTVDVFIAARDVPGGTQLGDATAVEPMSVASTALVFTRRDGAALPSLFTTHSLTAGQVIQRSDVAAAPPDVRLVALPIKDAPAAVPGSRVDLLSVTTDATGATSVQPFALGVEVRGSNAGGLVVAVTSREAAAFVYAAAAMHLVAVVADAGAAPGSEAPVSSPLEATEVASRP